MTNHNDFFNQNITGWCDWKDQSNKSHLHATYLIDYPPSSIDVVYIMAKVNYAGLWEAIYIGETSQNLHERLANHDKLQRAISLGATHLHVHFPRFPDTRQSVEKSLIENYRPPLNIEYIR